MGEEINVNDVSTVLLKNYEVKPLFKRRKIDIAAALTLVLLSIFGVSALLWNELSLGYTVVFDATLILTSFFLRRKGKKPNPSFLICGILSLVCSWSFFITSNLAIKIVSLFATAVSAIVWLTSVSDREYKPGDYGLIVYFFTALYRAFSDLPGVFKSLFSKDESKSKTISNILIGIACAIPAVLIIVPILAHADEAFGALISGLFDDYFILLQKTISGLIASIFIIAIVFSLKYNSEPYSIKKPSINVNSASISAFLGVLCLVYLVYLFSQLAYFFSAFSSILPKGYKFTYAGYARRGFFELCVISVINLIFIFAAILISEKKNEKLSFAIKLPSAFIVFFTFIIIFTALSKMVMYIGAYGCTVLRVSTSAFMIWLLVLYICVMIRIFRQTFDILKIGLIFALIILSVLGIGNINACIAKYNYNAYKDGKIKMDVNYMSDIGDEGIPYLYKLTRDKNDGIAYSAKKELSYKYEYYYDFGEKDIDDISSYKEFKKLEKSKGTVSKYSIPLSKAYSVLDKFAKEQNGNIK